MSTKPAPSSTTTCSALMIGVATTVPSLARMRAMALLCARAALAGAVSVRLKNSSGSLLASSSTGTVMSWLVSPGAKTTTPLTEAKSTPAVAVTPLVL